MSMGRTKCIAAEGCLLYYILQDTPDWFNFRSLLTKLKFIFRPPQGKHLLVLCFGGATGVAVLG